MSTEDNKALVRRYFDERWNRGNLAVIDELVAPRDIEGGKAYMEFMQTAFGDHQMEILDLLGDGDQVAVHLVFTGTHQGEYLGLAGTGKRITIHGMALLRIADGKIVEDVAYADNVETLKQLGVDPTSGQGGG
jgi:predicted ester cyclase